MTDGFWERGPLRRALYYGFGRWIVDVVERLRLHGARITIKTAAAVGIPVFVLFVFYPLELKGWSLWLQDTTFASHIALGVVAVALLIGMLTKYAKDAGRRDLVIWGTVLAVMAFAVSLASGWNYLLHEQQVARAKSAQAQAVVAVADVDPLEAFDAETSAMVSTMRQALADAPAASPTGRSRLVSAISEYVTQRAAQRVELVTQIAGQRQAAAVAAPLAVDPRPLDTVIASALPGDRDFWGVALDLLRALFVKSVVFFGLPLALTMAPEAKREADKKAAASERAKQQARKGGKWTTQRPRLTYETDDDPQTRQEQVIQITGEQPAPGKRYVPRTPDAASAIAGLMDEIAHLMGFGHGRKTQKAS
jgi:hypothetical protein